MLGSLMHRLEQRTECLGESLVATAATEPAGFFEIGLGVTADRALLGRRALFNLFGGTDSEEEIGQGKTGGILDAFLLGAGVAEVHLLHLAFQNLGQEDRCIIAFTNVAQHLFYVRPCVGLNHSKPSLNPSTFRASPA